ncbi:MAG: ABC transporter ATP-binding protein, partial [Actinomycetes bacterium]
LGRICEIAPSEDLYQNPRHPYTAALLNSLVGLDPEAPIAKATVIGEPPSPINPPSGCRFRTRCPIAQDRCAKESPELKELSPGHSVACHFPLNN